jgi:hypothetical protein
MPMKRSYKLLGLIWDQKPIHAGEEKADVIDLSVADFHRQRTLFEQEECRRRMPFEDVFGCEDDQALQRLVSDLPLCDVLYLVLDEAMVNSGRVLAKFYIRRVSQAHECLSKMLPGVDVRLGLLANIDSLEVS